MKRQSPGCSGGQSSVVTRALRGGVVASLVTAAATAVLAQIDSPPGPVDGGEVFRQTCMLCHGEDGRGGQGGGAPLDAVTDVGAVVTMVRDGRGNMPPLGEALTPEQIAAVANFVVNDLFN